MSLLVSTTCIALVICSYYLCLFLVNFCLRMASSSQRVCASLPSTEPSAPRWKYDVFLSFRGEETRKGIAFEIYDGLKTRGGVKTFMDDQELPVGASISPSLLKAIEESRFAIIVLSKNYASSSWCLEELTKIVDCMKDDERILPLFYHVEPSDVRHQRKSFKVAFTEHEATNRHDRKTVKQWRDALKTVANFSGWDTQNYKTERKLVQAIVESVYNKVGRKVGYLADYKINHQSLQPKLKDDVFPQEICLVSYGHYTAFHSRNSIVASVMDDLRSPDIEMILVHGIGGVGKTTIVEEVLRQATRDNLFDGVVMVRDVKENPDHKRIQKEISKKFGLKIDENDTLAERAPKLCEEIKDKRTLIVLDDVWEKIDLVAIGLPRLVNCKLVLTCRSRKDLSMDMRTQKDIPLDVLNEKEAWGLFEKMAGEVVKDGSIRNVAVEVAKKCGGLPLLIVTVARALKDRNKLYAWKDTLRRLSRFDKEELMEKAYLSLEWSYDQLEDKELKPLFLLCGTIVIKNHIYLEHLFKYGMGLGLFKNVNTMEEARDLLGTLVEKLIDSCLLLVSDTDSVTESPEFSFTDSNMYFRMHDLVCEVASRIAFRDQHVLSVGHGGELKEWPDKDFFKRCSKMSLESSNIPMLSEVPRECPKLEMFYLYSTAQRVKSVAIPSSFFSEMEKLKVLDLTKLHMLSLPSSLQFLKNLQTLCLEQCTLGDIALVGHLSNLEILSFAWSDVERLPKEIGQLIRLRWLDLSNCYELKVISPDVIARLERLEVLTMRNSFDKWEAERGGSNASLLELKLLSQLTALEIYIPDADILPTNLFSNRLVRYQIYIDDARRKNWWDCGETMAKTTLNTHSWDWGKAMAKTTLNTLKVKLTTSNVMDQGLKTLLTRCEDLSLDGTGSGNSIVYQSDIEDFQQLKHLHLQNNVDFTCMIDRKVVFSNLTALSVHSCGHLRFLFSFSMSKSLVELKHLRVSTCEIMEEIVSTRDQSDEETIDNMFRKLESLTLDRLPNLAGFYTRSYIEFPLEKNFDTELGASICDHRIGKKLDVKGDTIVQNCLFNSQVKFSSLEKLRINELRKLQTIWNNQLVDQDSFCRLRDVKVSKCKSLQKIFPTSVARGLQNLYRLRLEECDEVEEIIVGEEGLETTPLFVFPKVTRVTFYNMPKLSRFYPGMHVSKWPLLQNLHVAGCDKVKMFAAELPIFGKKHELDPIIEQSLFLINKDSFPNLEYLEPGVAEIWYGPSSPAPLFTKLKTISFGKCVLKQAALVFLQKLQNLDTLGVWENDSEEIFVNEEEMNSGGEMEMDAVGIHTLTLPRVKRLTLFSLYKLFSLDKLMHLGNHKSHPAGPLFPNLDHLHVSQCNKLKSVVESSAISVRNLTSLTVSYCDGLEYLTSYSVAKTLRQLTTLRVHSCDGLREIIDASNEDDHCEIAFGRLQELTLSFVPRLQGFCSGNCTVKLPFSTKLDVRYDCPIELKISSQGVLISNSKPKPTEEGGHDTVPDR